MKKILRNFSIFKFIPSTTEVLSRTVLEAPAFVSGLNSLTMVSQPVQQGRGHLLVAEHAGPFAERQIGGDPNGTRW